jgi:hypothetical protein
MTADDARLKELRRIAFGRTHSPEDEARATAAREELATLLAAPVAEPVEASTPVADVVEARAAVAEPAEAPAKPQRTRRPTWLVPAAIALLVGVLLGAGSMIATGGNVAATAPSPTFTPGSSGLPSTMPPLSANHPVEPGPGDVEAALRWFATDQKSADDMGDSSTAGLNLDPASTRLVSTGQGMNVWIAQTRGDELCVLAMPTVEGTGGGLCVSQAEFATSGIAIAVKGSLSVAWNGARFITSTASR